MDKLKMESPDLTETNVGKIAELFPNVVTEIKGEDGMLRKAVDFEKLKFILSADKGEIVDDESERYEFTWVGKKQSMVEAATPIRKTLRPCVEESRNWDTTQNLYIEGDNLEVLKLLQESYLGKVKMIYIDPPYNTGKDFIYKDNFTQSREEYEEELGLYDEEGNRLFQNTETNGRFHSDWCSMIYPRLLLARNLLTDDGVIFISIDDNEVGNLRKICDELFNVSNFIGTIVLQTATDNNPGQIKIEHEYIHCYCRDKKIQKYWYGTLENVKLIQNKYFELKNKELGLEEIQRKLREWIKKNKKILKGISHYDNVDEKGVYHDADIANTSFGGYEYDIIHPITGKVCKMPEKGYRFPEETMRKMLDEGNILFGEDETILPKPKKRLEDAKDVLRSVIYEDGRSSTKKFETLMERDIFQNPKSVTILSRLINFICKDNDIVLDFFSGSGTTAEAIFMNNLKRVINTHFILVQLVEDLDITVRQIDAKGRKTIKNNIDFLNKIDKKHTICELAKERIRRAGNKIIEENKDKEGIDKLDIGFRVFKLDTTNMKDVYYAANEYTQANLLDLISNIKEDRSDLDLLYGCLIDWGVSLDLPHRQEKINGFTVHFVNETDLIACFEEQISEDTIRTIAGYHPIRVVFRDASFRDSADRINVTEIFKAISPDTTVKVI